MQMMRLASNNTQPDKASKKRRYLIPNQKMYQPYKCRHQNASLTLQGNNFQQDKACTQIGNQSFQQQMSQRGKYR
jgi:hypothetical protein